jgi:Tol biopolymer transport system component
MEQGTLMRVERYILSMSAALAEVAAPARLTLLAALIALVLAGCRPAHSPAPAPREHLAERWPSPARAQTPPAAAQPTPQAAVAGLGKLAYVKGGDIWVKVLPDGEPQRLTADGYSQVPEWSSSGGWLMFCRGDDQHVGVMQADGGDTRALGTATREAVAWSPVADRLAYAANDELYVVQADGSGPVMVAHPLGVHGTPPQGEGRIGRVAWSPDGAWIAYEWAVQQPGQPLSYQGLWRVGGGGGEPLELYASGAPKRGDAILAGWSSDGEHIFFWQGDILSASMLADGVSLYSLPAGGGEPNRLVDTMLVHGDFAAPESHGDRLAVTAGAYRATWTRKRVAVVRAGGTIFTWLTDEGWAAFSPTWSPDGVHLAYAAMPDRGDLVGGEAARLGMMQRRIWVASADDQTRPVQLTDDPAYRDESPFWSAAGSHILFARIDADDRASLWLISAAGGEPVRVVEELGPLPGPAEGWFGYYGHVDWPGLYDWWPGPDGEET